MIRVIAKRLLGALPNLLGVIVITFVLTRALPGDPAAYFAGAAATQEAIEQVRARRGAGFIEAARLSGNGDVRILAVHLFPNILPPAMVQVSLNMGWAILNAAGLSFIGLGVRPPTSEWGILVAEGAQFIVSGEWWVSSSPAQR
jgi:ABC-type dipeptide/oligopeptide/nickel transport system permease subunit